MGKHINDYCRYKDYCVESTICDDDGRDKHCIEIRVPILNDDGNQVMFNFQLKDLMAKLLLDG